MPNHINRRSFIKAAGLAGLAAMTSSNLFAQSNQEPIGIAFIGVGHIHTPGFIGTLNDRKDFKVKAVWDHDKERAARRAKELDAPVVDDLGKIWSDRSIKAVIICSETNRHRELVIAAARAGKHMFVEKPLGITAKESYEMAKAINDKKLLFQTGYFMRADPKFIFLKEEISSGRFGKITRIRGSNCHSGSLGNWFGGEWRWMADPKQSGVGAFGDLGTHKLDIMLWLCGDVNMATADIEIVTGKYEGCDEAGEGLMQFKDGMIGTLAASWVDIEDPVELQISGTDAYAIVRGGRLYYRNNKTDRKDFGKAVEDLPQGLPQPLNQFLDAVGGKKVDTLVTPDEAAYRVSVMEAMYTGSKKRTWEKPLAK